MYAGRKDEARDMARKFLVHMKDNPERFARLRPRYLKIAEFLAFNLSEENLLKSCEGLSGNYCDAHALIGFRRLGDGDRAGAIDHFRQAVETGVYLGPFIPSLKPPWPKSNAIPPGRLNHELRPSGIPVRRRVEPSPGRPQGLPET